MEDRGVPGLQSLAATKDGEDRRASFCGMICFVEETWSRNHPRKGSAWLFPLILALLLKVCGGETTRKRPRLDCDAEKSLQEKRAPVKKDVRAQKTSILVQLR